MSRGFERLDERLNKEGPGFRHHGQRLKEILDSGDIQDLLEHLTYPASPPDKAAGCGPDVSGENGTCFQALCEVYPEYMQKARTMVIRALSDLPELEPEKRWNRDREDTVSEHREQVSYLLQFVAYLGKDSALFDAMCSNITNEQLEAHFEGYDDRAMLVNTLMESLPRTQTDRRLVPTWWAILGKDLNPDHLEVYYPGQFEMARPVEGYIGLILAPPLQGDLDAPPMDLIPQALAAYSCMMTQDREEDQAVKSLRFRIDELTERVGPGNQKQLIQSFQPNAFPDWAKSIIEEYQRSE